MHHGGGPPNVQRNLQRSKSFTGSEAEDQQQQQQPQQPPANGNHPQSPVTSFAPAASPSAPQSPNYQIIMSRSPVTGQNMNITLQNVGPMVSGNQQITLTSLPLQSPTSPGFQHQPQQWRFEPGSSSYIQVTSPLPQTMQPQSPTQHSPVPIQALPRPCAPGSALGVCSQSPTRFVEAGIMVRQISLGSPPGSGHFVYQEGTGLAQLASTTAGTVQLTSPGTQGAVRERRLSQPHSQTGGTIHHLGPQSPVATLGSPGHITTSNLPPQISSIIQGQLGRPMIFEKTAQGVVAGVAVTSAASFGVPSAIPPSSPSRSNPPQGLSNQSLTPTSMKKMQPKKLEEIAPSNPEVAQLRKQCLEHHGKKMESLKEVFKEYLIELFFLQHLQGNMMDYLAFKKKPCVPLFTYLRQNDLELEDEEDEEEQSEVINDEVKVVTGKDGQTVTPVAIATQLPPNVFAAFSAPQQFQAHAGVAGGSISNPVDMEAFKRQQAITQAGGMPPTPQTVQVGGQKQNQQQYDPSKGPPVQNAASLHTPPPQLPGRLPQGGLPLAGLPLSLSQGQALVVEQHQAVLAPVNPHAQLQAQLQQMQSGLHLQMQQQQQQQMQQSVMQPGQATVALMRPGSDSSQPAQRLMSNSLSTPVMSPSPLTSPSSLPTSHPSALVHTPTTGPNLSTANQSKLAATNGTAGLKMSGLCQSPIGQNSQERTQDKQAEQAKLESHVHQRIAELRKEGQWSASRLPKLQEACRPKSHWDYLLEEMQWMAADFAQERRWKMAAAKKLVRTCVRYHDEQKKTEERVKREEEMRLRHIASTIARSVDYFWSNIEQVVEIKLRFEIYDKQQKVLSLRKAACKKQCAKPAQSSGVKSDKENKVQEAGPSRKRKSSTSLSDVEVEDEESTIEEQEANEVAAEQKAELAELTKEAEVPLGDLVKQYAGAYAESFDWPQPSSQSEDEDKMEADDMDSPCSPHEAVLIDSLLSMDQYRGAERKTYGTDGKPKKDIAEVAAATDLILPKGSARTTLSSRSPPPPLLHGSLREYQQVGVEWLVSLHRKNLNGILADETGLGKTVQTVAFFAHLACNQGIWGPHLVVVRTCKLLNWEMEFKRWCPGLKILLYLGNRRQRRFKRSRWCEPNSLHVCVTSYKLLLKDQAYFLRRRWRHLVLDEVQLIKNLTEKHWETIFNIKNHQRILLINMPLQNTLKELWTMIHFLLPGITHPYLNFPVKPGTDQNQDYCHKLVIRLHRMIQPFILRRSKRDVEKQLPKKYEHILKCRLSKRQKSMYEDILIQPSAQEALKTGHFVRVLEVLMQLQRICNHPDLIQARETHNSYVCQPLQYDTPSLVLTALQQDQWKTVNMSLFDLIGNEGKRTRHEAEEVLPKLRMTKQLIEEIYSASDPPPRPKPCKINPMRLFLPVQYGTKPEGRLVPMTSSTTQSSHATAVTTAPTTTTTPTTVANTQTRGKSPLTTSTQATTVGSTTVTTPATTDADPNAKASTNTTSQQSNEERNRQLKERLACLFHANERRSSRSVLYGSDLVKACSVYEGRPPPSFPAPWHSRWTWVGRDSCLRAQQTCVSTVAPLRSAILSSTEQEEATGTLRKRFSCVLPAAVAPPPQLYAANPPPSYSLAQKALRRQLQEVSAPHNAEIWGLACPAVVSSPDVHILEMDSGKLEALSILLQKLRAENRRVLIFTQMTSMLDLLEAFLDHHHLTYVRLDESLSLEERQEQVKRFNRNRQVFCTILTNRCCSAVGHVFDADTIVFYDTDLNPSMDMRTQEWCEKIGRSKDIHLYRLESGNSIEEKLLKNGTKDLIREVAAQGMDYTLAFLTQRTIQDLFEVEAGSGEKVEEFVVLHQEPFPSESIPPHVARPYIQALNSIRLETKQEEEETDVEREDKGSEEVEGGDDEMAVEEGVRGDASQLEELAAVMEQLTPIERYALHYLEYLHISEDEQAVKERIEAAKRGWELQQMQRLKVEKDEQMMLEDEEDLFTYTREDAYNMEYVFENEDGQTEIMPLWTPLTPPQDDNDIYIDSVICLMYDSAPMPESKLPPVYVRKERKRHMDPSAVGRKKKKGQGEAVIPPRSLFDKASLLKVRREGKDQKKNFSLKQQAPFAKPLPSLLKPAMDAGQDNPEWLISEDWALLQAVKQLLELPLNLTIVSPAHTPNWDLVSDVVNSCSRIYRSPKQCRNRYENVIIPREEGKLIYEANPKKNKTKSIYKSKNSRPLRTSQIYSQDDNTTQIQLYNSRFELIKIIASKRSPPIKPLLGMNPFQKNPKHASVLAESGISYDKPLPPIQVASQRAERIAKEKKALAEQQRAQQLAQQQSAGAAQPQGAATQPQVQPQATGVPQPNQPGAAAVPNTAVLAGAIKTAAVGTSIQPATATVSGNVIVNTVAGVTPGQFQANKRLASPVIPAAGTATAQVVHTQQRAVPATGAPAEVVAIATGQGVRAVTPVTASAVVSTNLTPGQSQTRTLVAPAAGMQLPQCKQITQAQVQLFRQQPMQQQQQQAASPQIKAVGKPQQELLKKQKLQMAQQQVVAAVAAAQGQQAATTQQPQQVQAAPATQANAQLAAVAAPRAGAVLTGATVTNLQVARLTRVPAPGTIQAQPGQTAQVTLTKPPPVVSVPAVVSSAGVTTLPVTVAGISVAIGQAQKAGGQVVTHPFQVQQVQQLLHRHKQQAAAQAAAVQKAAQSPQTQAALQQKQAAQTTAQQQQKVTYAATTQLQPGIKTQFFTTSIAQPQKPATAQQIQVAKLPQIVQQQIVSSPQQIQTQPQTVALTQAAPVAGSAQVQVIPAGTATAAQVVQQKLLQQQVVTTAAAASPQIQTPPPHSPAQQQSSAAPPAESPVQLASTPQPQQGKGNTRTGGAMRSKTPAKPSSGS
ncbi:E1A-binding protein p400-like isoform X9 [Myxocyprinus asiaticus]|uniref:E1A-binding protein p400-like isoform X9 n=1 Tax=Myxocyprinus asiaticus TaxID=70543 RepID=UPI002222E301|nr:E1A-binding protein p400-like isoform X9 [Myxocyprinus asiaticus]